MYSTTCDLCFLKKKSKVEKLIREDVTYPIGAYKRLESKIFHDHYKTTGNNNDEVYQETSKTKKFTKRAYKTPEVHAMKEEWTARWEAVLNAN